MKARLLTKILNDTKYCVNNNKDYIAVGSPMRHKLINVDKKTLELNYALDTFHEGRKALLSSNAELLFIYDKLQELIDNGQIKDIIEGQDEIENPITVYTFEDGKLIETFTDKLEWPNTTINGDIMYENTYFKDKKEAIEYGIKECRHYVKMFNEQISDWEEKLKERKDKLDTYKKYIENLKSIK